jgi:hypothetical protein
MEYVKIVLIILVVLGLVANWIEKRRLIGREKPNKPISVPTKTAAISSGYRVDITQSGNYGDIVYSENGREAKFGWEFGGSVLAVIDIPPKSVWSNRFPFPATRRREIGERVANEVIRQKAPRSNFRWTENLIQILEN